MTLKDTLKCFWYENAMLKGNNNISVQVESYPAFFKIKIDNSKDYEIPVCCLSYFKDITSNVNTKNMDIPDICEFLFPLYEEPDNNKMRVFQVNSAVSAMKHMFNVRSRYYLTYMDIHGYYYYGNFNTIFDSDFNILMMATIAFCNDSSNNWYPILRISPEVFENSTKPLEKLIISHIIPYIATTKQPIYLRKISLLDYKQPSIIISDGFNNIEILKPEAPDFGETFIEETNNVIRKYWR